TNPAHARTPTLLFTHPATTKIYTLSLHDALPIFDGLNTIDARHTGAWDAHKWVIEPYGTIYVRGWQMSSENARRFYFTSERDSRSEEHTSELQSRGHLVCRLLLEKKKKEHRKHNR